MLTYELRLYACKCMPRQGVPVINFAAHVTTSIQLGHF